MGDARLHLHCGRYGHRHGSHHTHHLRTLVSIILTRIELYTVRKELADFAVYVTYDANATEALCGE